MRSNEFIGGSGMAREEPQFRTLQQEGPRSYVPSSTLSQLFPGQNGRAADDQERVLLGIRNSAVGSSQDTFQRSLWLRNLKPTLRYDVTQG